jgi:peptidase M15-like protein
MIKLEDVITGSYFASRVVLLAAQFDFSVTSWGRTAQHNKAVGGNPLSRHLDFCACDVILDKPEDQTSFLAQCVKNDLHYKQEGDHIHLQDRPALPV